jgi:YHS domain-containing protein
MIKLILLVLICLLVVRVASRLFLTDTPRQNRDQPMIDDEMVKDPVCGMYVPQQASFSLQHNGQVHYFCSDTCRNEFKMRPSDMPFDGDSDSKSQEPEEKL